MEKLFIKYPTVYYMGLECLDITRRVKISEANKQNISLYNPLEIKSGLRADHIADAYYEDAELDWMIYLANEIIDPYYGWYLDDREFYDYIRSKYGEIEYAIKKIKCFRNNWANDMSQITVSFYNNNLAWDEKPYWNPVYGQGTNIIGYQRKRQDWLMNTNRIVQYEVYYQSGDLFENGEIVDIIDTEPVGRGEVVTSNATHLHVHHVFGNTVANTTWTKEIVGETSKTKVFTNSAKVVAENISNTQSKYWRPVTYLDWEIEQNESKKIMNIIDNQVVFDLSEGIRMRLLEE